MLKTSPLYILKIAKHFAQFYLAINKVYAKFFFFFLMHLVISFFACKLLFYATYKSECVWFYVLFHDLISKPNKKRRRKVNTVNIRSFKMNDQRKPFIIITENSFI